MSKYAIIFQKTLTNKHLKLHKKMWTKKTKTMFRIWATFKQGIKKRKHAENGQVDQVRLKVLLGDPLVFRKLLVLQEILYVVVNFSRTFFGTREKCRRTTLCNVIKAWETQFQKNWDERKRVGRSRQVNSTKSSRERPLRKRWLRKE